LIRPSATVADGRIRAAGTAGRAYSLCALSGHFCRQTINNRDLSRRGGSRIISSRLHHRARGGSGSGWRGEKRAGRADELWLMHIHRVNGFPPPPAPLSLSLSLSHPAPLVVISSLSGGIFEWAPLYCSIVRLASRCLLSRAISLPPSPSLSPVIN